MSSIALNTRIMRLVYAHGLFWFARKIFGLFFTLFIWSQTQSIAQVGLYYLAHILTHTIFFVGFAPLAKKGKAHIPRIFSLASLVLVYSFIAFLGPAAIDHLVLIGLLTGIGNGSYWMSYIVIRFDITHSQNRGNYHGKDQAIRKLGAVVGPILGGWLIFMNFFGLGYEMVFLVAALSYFLSIFVGYIPLPSHEIASFKLKAMFKKIWSHIEVRKVTIARLFGNIGHKGPIERLLPIFIFDVLQNEFHLGGWFTLFSVVAMIGVWFFGQYIPYTAYQRTLTFSGSLFFLSLLALVGFPGFVTYIIFGIATEFFKPGYEIPTKVYRDNAVSLVGPYGDNRVEYIVARELITVSLSRFVGYGIFLFVGALDSFSMQVLLVGLACATLVELLLMRSLNMNLEKI